MEGWHPLWLRYLPGVPPHLFFEVLAVVVGLGLALRRRKARSKSPVPVTVSALVGAVLGARVLGLLVDPSETWSLRASLGGWMQQQTVVGGILGGWAAVEVAKHRLGIRRSTADSFVLPLTVALSVGRLGCFFSGVTDRTHGRPWTGPFAMDLGDGVLRHPLALYEGIVVMAIGLAVHLRSIRPALRWRLFVFGYLAWRFASAPIAPPAPVVGPLTTIQIASLVGMVVALAGMGAPPSDATESAGPSQK